jgi:CheY-like chemotaxis protein
MKVKHSYFTFIKPNDFMMSFNNNVFLAEDDDDDCVLFEDVLKELSLSYKLTIASNGEKLMEMLTGNNSLPDILFLDLNMPLKTGFECLKEIKQHTKLRHLPIIVFSTSAQPSAVDALYDMGATLYIRKPSTYGQLQERIKKIFSTNWQEVSRLSREEYFWP